MEDKKNKVFFIISNQSSLDKTIEYSLSNINGMSNFNLILKKSQKYQKEDFTTNIFYFEITPKELKESDKDPQSNKYKAKIILKNNKTNFEGIILFKENKNNFIYDFKFNEDKNLIEIISPPNYIKYSKFEQLTLFNDVLRILKVKQNGELYKDLVIDSIYCIDGQQYFLDFYLQVFKSCFTQKEVINLLMMFNLESVILPEKMEYQNIQIF